MPFDPPDVYKIKEQIKLWKELSVGDIVKVISTGGSYHWKEFFDICNLPNWMKENFGGYTIPGKTILIQLNSMHQKYLIF